MCSGSLVCVGKKPRAAHGPHPPPKRENKDVGERALQRSEAALVPVQRAGPSLDRLGFALDNRAA